MTTPLNTPLPAAPVTRLAREFKRLYGPAGDALALVLEVARPAAWQPLAAVWQGVQADLGLPAPAIAANGRDGLQLWFSLTAAQPAAEGLAFLKGLRQRYLPDVPLHRVTLSAGPAPQSVPAQVSSPAPREDRWSAFVAADLAALFEDTPWLDLPPNDEGQADLLSRLRSMQAAPFADALARLRPSPAHPPALQTPPAVGAGLALAEAGTAGAAPHEAARQFLLQVLQDESAPLALRVEAAKALLPYGLPR